MDSSPPLKGYAIPVWLLVLYAVLFTLLGWFSAGKWHEYQSSTRDTKIEVVPTPHPVLNVMKKNPVLPASQDILPTCIEGELMPLKYSAHIYTDDEAKRSVTFNGQQYHEGSKLDCGGEVVQIQQEVTVLEYEGKTVLLDALQDWPGGPPEESEGE